MLTQQPTEFITDPLALQFMTGGQMGYMPQAQFLTPAEYGAFRTMPVSPQNNFLHQDPGLVQSWLIRNYGGPFGLPRYTFNTYNPAVNQQLYMHQMETRSLDSLLGGAGAITDLAFQSLLGSATGMLLGGPAGLAVGLGASMFGLNPSESLTDRIRDMRLIQNLSMAKIGDSSRDVNPVTGMGFNAVAARNIDSFLRRSASNDPVLKDEDWRKLLQLGIEYGQFDYANNATQYKDILKKMRGNLTTVMEVMGSTEFKDIMKEFKRLQTMGADINQYGTILRKENMLGRMTGLSHSAMVQAYGQPGALIYSQHGLNNYQGSIQAMNNAATVAMAQRMGILSPATVARHGGQSGMVQTMTNEDADVLSKMKDYVLPYFMNDDLTALDLSKDPLEILNSPDPLHLISQSWGKLDHPTRAVNYRVHRDEVYGQLLDKIPSDLIEAIYANSIGRTMLPGTTGPDATRMGFIQLGMSPWHAQLAANEAHSDRFKQKYEREQELAAQKRREELAVKYNPFRVWTREVKNWWTDLGERVFGGLSERYGQWSEERSLRLQGRGRTWLPGAGVSLSWNEQVKKDRQKLEIGAVGEDNSTPYGVFKGQFVAENGQIFNWDEAQQAGKKRLLGASLAGFESDKDGVYFIGYDRTGGTSYGTYQLSSARGSYQEWIDNELNNVAPDVAQRLKKAGTFNTGSTQGAAVDVYKREAQANPELFATTQHEYIKRTQYRPALQQLQPELRTRIQRSPALQDMLWSTAVQHGATSASTILNAVYKQNPKQSDANFVSAVYTERGKHFQSSTPQIRQAVQKRFKTESQKVLGMLEREQKQSVSLPIPQTQATATQPVSPVPSNSAPIRNLVAKYATQVGVNPSLMEAIILQQSGGKADFVNPETQGVGLFGLTPDVIKEFRVTKPQNTEENIKAGVQHYRALLHHYDNNERLAVTAMHMGTSKVDSWLRYLDRHYPGRTFTFTNTHTGSLSEQDQNVWQQLPEDVRDFYANVLNKQKSLAQPVPEQNVPVQAPVQPQGTLPLALQKVFIEQAKIQHVDPHLLTALAMQRSNGNVNFVDEKTHATGLFALTPERAKQLGVDVAKPEQNIEGGARHLRQLLDHYYGNERLALTAFSMGKESLDAWLTHVYQQSQNKEFEWKPELSEDAQKVWDTLPEEHRNVASTVLLQNLDRSKIKTTPTSTPRTSLGEANPELLRAISKEIAKRTKEYDKIKYKWGSKKLATGSIDCSGWSEYLLAAMAQSLKDKNGQPIFSPELIKELRQQVRGKGAKEPMAAAEIIQSMGKLSGQELNLTGKVQANNIESILREGMFLGFDTGVGKKEPAGRYKGIDHIAMVYRDPTSGELRISESTGAVDQKRTNKTTGQQEGDGQTGVRSISASEYFQRSHIRNAKVYAVDFSALSRPERGMYFTPPPDWQNKSPQEQREYRYRSSQLAEERRIRETLYAEVSAIIDGAQKRDEEKQFKQWRSNSYDPSMGSNPEEVYKALNIKPATDMATVTQIYYATQNFADNNTDLVSIGQYLQDAGYKRADGQDYTYNTLRQALWNPKYKVKNIENSDALYTSTRQVLEKLGVAPEALAKLEKDRATQAVIAGGIFGLQKRVADNSSTDPRSGNNVEELEHFYNQRTENFNNEIRSILAKTNQEAVEETIKPFVETLGLDREKANQLDNILAYDEKSSPEYYPILNYLFAIQEYNKLQGTKLSAAQQRYKKELFDETAGEGHILSLGMQRFGKSRDEVLRDLQDIRNVQFNLPDINPEYIKSLQEAAELGSQHYTQTTRHRLKRESDNIKQFRKDFGYTRGNIPLQLTRGLDVGQRLALARLMQGQGVTSVTEFNTPEGRKKFDHLYDQIVQVGLGSPEQQSALRIVRQKLDAGQTLTDDDIMPSLALQGKTIKLTPTGANSTPSWVTQTNNIWSALAKQGQVGSLPKNVSQGLVTEQIARGLAKENRTNGDLTEETLTKLNKTLEGLNATLKQMNKNYAKNMGGSRP